MKVICDRAALLDAVNLVTGVAATRSPKPQLTCVRLEASKQGSAGQLTLFATDGEVTVRLTTANVEVSQPGETLIPAQKLQQIVAAEDADPTLTLHAEGDKLTVKGQGAKFTVYGFPAADFPPAPDFPEPGQKNVRAIFKVMGSDFALLTSRTLFATARETSRYAINGVLMKAVGKKLEMVATDGRRLALARGVAEGAPADPGVSAIIPSKALNLVSKLIDGSEDTVRIAITDNQAMFWFGDAGEAPRALLTTALVEGAFPPYEEVIPRDSDKKAVFDVIELRNGVRKAALLTNEESRGVRMAFTSGKSKGSEKKLRLSSRAPEVGEADIDVALESFDGEDIEIGFNPSFITDALKVVNDPQVVVEMKAPNKPGIIKAGPDFLYVVMPVSLQ